MGSQQESGRAGLFRRIAATGIDVFLAYAVASLLVVLAPVVGLRLALEPVLVVLLAGYGAVALARTGHTIGKRMLGVEVTRADGSPLGWWTAARRELAGKWGIGVLLPLLLGRLILGRGWVPTLYDLPVLAAVGLLTLGYYAVVKVTWYARLARTAVGRAAEGPRLTGATAATLAAAVLIGPGVKGAEYLTRGWIPCRLAQWSSMAPIGPYVDFLEEPHASPKDYVLGLFEQHDVVLLTERLHPEGSQWEFIFDLVRDPRFIDEVGHVFTEYGQVGMQGYLDEMMSTDDLSPEEVHDRATHIMRHWAVWPVRTQTNFHTYLTRLYELNQSLSPDKRVRHHFTDGELSWGELTTAQEYRTYRRSLRGRDQLMAQNVIEPLARLEAESGRRPRGLVVMNYRHGFDLTGRDPEVRRENTLEFLKDALGDRVAAVLLNTRILMVAPVAGGRWDAAFEAAGDPRVGFDLAGSPFGEDPFDQFPFRWNARGLLRYRDVFTGYAFVHPWAEQYFQDGIPGYYAGFEEEALRRASLLGEGYRSGIEEAIERERRGEVALKQTMPGYRIETGIEVTLLVVVTLGLLFGVAFWAVDRKRRTPVNAPPS